MARILNSVATATPLLLNGYALVANAGLSSVLGIVFWMLATRLYSQDQVGLAAALISMMTTISYLSQMNLSSFLTRFIPLAQAGAGRLILKSYAASGTVAALVAATFALGVGDFAEPLQVIRSDASAIVFFVAATVAWTLFTLQDAALSGLRRSVVVPIENAIYAVLKICFLVVLSMVILPAPGGIFMAWTLPLIPVVVVINALIFRRLPKRTLTDRSVDPDLRTVTRFLGWDFLGSLALATAYGLAPLMVTASAGFAATATYHLAWSFAYSVYLIGRALSVSLVAEGAANPLRLHRLISDTLCHTLFLVISAVLVMFAAAPLIMGLFGQDYVSEGAPILRVLALACIPWAVTTIYCAAARARGQTRSVAAVQTGTLAVFVAVSSILLSGFGALGVALGWLAAHTTVCTAIIISVMLRGGADALTDWLLALSSSAARLLGGVLSIKSDASRTSDSTAERLLGEIDLPGIADLAPIPVSGSLSEVTAVLLKAEDPPPGTVKAVLKYATNERGIAALQRNAQVLETLAVNEQLEPFREILPEILLIKSAEDSLCTIETAVSGIEGRNFLGDAGQANAAMAAVAAVMAEMHRRTAKPCTLDDAWAEQWIDERIKVADASRNVVVNGDRRTEAFERLRVQLRRVFVGRDVYLGLGHGDLWPGNIFYSASDGQTDKPELSGLIDWDTSRTDTIAAIDACHLGFTFRMEQSGKELGTVVIDVLKNGWTSEEIGIFENAGYRDAFGKADDYTFNRAIVVLTWLHHVAIVLRKSDRPSANPIWTATNVDRVLPTIALSFSEVPN